MNTFTRITKSPFFPFFTLMGIGLLSLTISLLTLSTQSIRLDEAQSIWVSTKSLGTILKLTSEDVHVPLYGTLLHFWMQFFGTSIEAARTLSLIFFTATIIPLYFMIKEAAGRKLALISITMFSLSPFIAWYSNEARMYTLFTFATSLVHLYFLRFLRSDGKAARGGLISSMVLGMYTHYFFLFMLASQGIYLLIYSYSKWSKLEKPAVGFIRSLLSRDSIIVSYALSLLTAGLFFAPWIIYVISGGSASNTQPLIAPPTSYNIFQTFVNFIFGFQTLSIQSDLVSLWPLSVLILFFIFTKKKHIPVKNLSYFAMVTFFPIILVFGLSYLKPIFLSRYLILVTPTLFFMIALLFLHYSKKVAILLVTGFIFITFGLMLYQNISTNTPIKENYVGAAKYVSQKATTNDIVAVTAPFTIYPFEYSYTGAAKIVTIPEWDRYITGSIPPFSKTTFEKEIATFKTQYIHLYIVLSYDQGYEETIKQYLDSHLQRISLKKFSEGLEVREYVLRYDVTQSSKK